MTRLLPAILLLACTVPEPTGTQLAPPSDLTVWASPFVPGQPASIIAEGLDPFERTHFIRGVDLGPGTCIQTAGNLCLDITRGVYLGNRDADATGRASLNLQIPDWLPPGTQGYFQVIALRGPNSIKSDPLFVEVLGDDIDGDGFTSATDCDDRDATVYPGALERCDGIDNDCDASTTEDGLIIVDDTVAAFPYALDHALSIVAPGGTIEMCAGTFPTPYTRIQQAVTIRGQGQGATILDAGGSNALLRLEHEGITLESMTLMGTSSTSNAIIDVRCGAPSICDYPGAITLRDVEVTGNGTAVEVPTIYDHQLLIEGCNFHDLSSSNGGLAFQNTVVEMNNTTVADISTGHSDGALTLFATTFTGQGNTFHRNSGRSAIVLFSGTFACTDCDWGAGLDDNQPHDLAWRPSSSTYTYEDWYGVDSIQCHVNGIGCGPL